MPLPRPKKLRNVRPRGTKAAEWLKLEQRLENLEGRWGDGEIINIAGWKTIRYRETADDIIILAELTTESAQRCDCGTTWAEMTKWGYTDPTYVIDIPIRSKRTRIYYRLQRRRCLECRKMFQQPLPGIDEQHTMFSGRLVEYIGRESFSISRSFSGIANEVGCSEIKVRKIFTARALRFETGRVIEAPQWLAIDEVYPKRYGSAYCVISAPEIRQVLDLIPNNRKRKKNAINPKVNKGIDATALWIWLLNLKYRDKVLVVTIDMCAQYRSIVQRLLKNAIIVVDRYHVHNMLNVALKGVLEVLRDGLTPSEQRRLMRRMSLVLKNYRHLSKMTREDENGQVLPSEKDLFKKWLKDMPDLAVAYWLKKDFSDILQLSDRQKAEQLTDAWLDRACEFVKYFRGKYQKTYRGHWEDPFGNVPNTIIEWRKCILNYIDYKNVIGTKRKTNAFAEFANKQIKKAFQTGNGYSAQVLRVKVIHGGVLVIKRPPHPLDQKWTRSKSDRSARRGPKSQREVNPNSNLALLESARDGQDKTRGLLPEPQETTGWIERFGSAARNKDVSGSDELLYMEMLKEFEPEEKEVVRRGRRPFRHDSRQFKMF